MNTTSKFYFIDKKSVGFIKFIFEAYDGIAVVETIDRKTSLIKLHVAPGCEKDVDDLMNELKKEIVIESVCPGPDKFFTTLKDTVETADILEKMTV